MDELMAPFRRAVDSIECFVELLRFFCISKPLNLLSRLGQRVVFTARRTGLSSCNSVRPSVRLSVRPSDTPAL